MSTNNTLKLKDGTILYYKDWGEGQPIFFHHGWPLTADAFEDQMFFLASHGYRVIAPDRRGHGRSSQPWHGHNMDQYADDTAELVEALDLVEAVHVGHSTGGGVVARYIARHGTNRTAKAALIGAVPPGMIKTDYNPDGLTIDVFDGIRKGVQEDRATFFKELAETFYGFNLPGAKRSQGLVDSFQAQGLQGSIKAMYDCIKAFSETDQREDLQKMTIPTLVLYGDKDQIVPPKSSSERAIKLLPNPTVKVYPGASHGLCSTHKDQVNKDLLEFIRAK